MCIAEWRPPAALSLAQKGRQLWLQMVRNAVKHHLGQELPSPPKPPHVAPYGDVQMSQAMSLAEALEGLWPGEGIVSKRPLHMEEYGQG